MIKVKPFGSADVIMEFTTEASKYGNDSEVTIETENARELMDFVRELAHRKLVMVRYPMLDDTFRPFYIHGVEDMDLASQVALYDAQEQHNDADNEVMTLLVCPAPLVLPDDGMLNYVSFVNLYDMKDVDAMSVLVVKPDVYDVLKLVTENPLMFKRRLVVLEGLPGAEYTPEFESATWSCEKASYAALLSELSVNRETSENAALRDRSVFKTERDQVERSDGSVKAHDAKIATLADDSDDGGD